MLAFRLRSIIDVSIDSAFKAGGMWPKEGLMRRFFAPRDSKVLVWMTKMLVPVLVAVRHGEMDMQMSREALERFAKCRGKRAIICPNHPSREDADAMFGLATLVGESFNFMTAQQLFHGPGWSDLWLQYMGCYSVFRDSPDFSAFKTTRELLVKGKKKIVIFPEGEISHQNDTLMPLKPGAVQMGFSAVGALKQKGLLEPVFILPVAMKYTYRHDITKKLSQALKRLEGELAIASVGQESFYRRLRRVATAVVATLEATYNLKADEKATLGERIAVMRKVILSKVAAHLEVDLPEGKSQLVQAHTLQNILYELRFRHERKESSYERKEHRQRFLQLKSFYRDLKRAINFIAVFDGYLEDPSTQERIAEIIQLLESEVFGRTFPLGARRILFDVGEPINLLDYYSQYCADKQGTVETVKQKLGESLSAMLADFDRQRVPVYVSLPSAPCHS